VRSENCNGLAEHQAHPNIPKSKPEATTGDTNSNLSVTDGWRMSFGHVDVDGRLDAAPGIGLRVGHKCDDGQQTRCLEHSFCHCEFLKTTIALLY